MKIIAFIAFILLSSNTFVADVTGHWKGKIMGEVDITYDFVQDGEKLTGKTTGPDGNTITIDNGVIKGDDISFSLNIMGNAAPVTGKVNGNTMALAVVFDGNPMPFELKKEVK